MTFEDALASQPAWIGIWLYVLMAGAFVAPVVLLIWKSSRKAGLLTLQSSIIAVLSVRYMFNMMGYVKLLGLPHVIIWIPTVVFLIGQQALGYMTIWPRRIIWVIITVICISLAFDIVDVARWVLGERAPLV